MKFGKAAATEELGKPMSLLDAFQRDLDEALSQIASSCAPEVAAVEKAATALQKLQDSVTALEAQLTEKTARGDRLRAEASQALADGKDVAGLIRARAEVMAEIEAITDLITDVQEVRLPEAQKAYDTVSASLIDCLTKEVTSLRRSLQEKYIGGMITMAGEMAEAYMVEMKKLAAMYAVPGDSTMAFRHSQIYTPLDVLKMR